MSNSREIGLVLLAAGASKRLGQPKQLIPYKGKSLLQHTIDCAEGLNLQMNVLVIGANAKAIQEIISAETMKMVINENWESGMGSSLKLGVKEILQLSPELDAVIVLVSDQPFIHLELLKEMTELYNSENDIVGSEYKDVVGVPVLFGRSYFKELQELSGDQGARRIINKHQNCLKKIKFEQGNFDIDTPADLEQLNNLNSECQ